MAFVDTLVKARFVGMTIQKLICKFSRNGPDGERMTRRKKNAKMTERPGSRNWMEIKKELIIFSTKLGNFGHCGTSHHVHLLMFIIENIFYYYLCACSRLTMA